jgi:hypothetical protein
MNDEFGKEHEFGLFVRRTFAKITNSLKRFFLLTQRAIHADCSDLNRLH